jgi:branched-chain amino acid aminotransferase
VAAVVNVNGRISDDTHASVSVLDHGFLFGEGVYETLRTYDRQPFLFDRHARRLRHSAAMIDLAVPVSDEELRARVRDTMEASRLPDEAYIRILLTRGPGDLSYDPRSCPTPTLVVIVKPHVDPPAEVFEQGVTISLVTVLRNHPGAVNPLIKSNNLLNNALAMQEAFRKGGYEALMRNYLGELTECSQSNFFLVKDGVALTPPVEAGLLEGITRNVLFEVGRAIGVEVRESTLMAGDLPLADESFITSTTRELVPVVRVDDQVIGSGRPGPITQRLLDGFRRIARAATLR